MNDRKTFLFPAKSERRTVGEYAQELIELNPSLTSYDTALEWSWLKHCLSKGYDPRGKVVTAYGADGCFGRAVGRAIGLTQEWDDELWNFLLDPNYTQPGDL